jgi:SP family arabinose:H+ symporter-like MFS transporter
MNVDHGSRVYLYFAALVAATSGFLFGFDIAVINGALLFLRDQLHLSEIQTETAASALLFGCILGASIGGWLSDRFGRRRVLMLSAALFALSAFGAASARSLVEFSGGRFIGGIAIGAASVLAPLYIAEISPARNRGRLVALNQMAIVTGILVAYLANWLLSFGGASSWRWMFATAAIPAAAFFVGLLFVPESPRWLVEKDRSQDALEVLARVSGRAAALTELRQIEETVAGESGSLVELFQPGLRRALGIAVSLAILQQVTGINTVLFYGSVIFKEHVGTGSDTSAIFANVLVGLVNVLATIVALSMIDKLGRRPLLMFSSGAMAVGQLALGLAFLSPHPPAALVLGIMLVCAASFAVGLGPGVWVVLSEIFPTRIRGRAMAIATVSLWCACTLLTMTFLSLTRALSATGAFAIYSSMCVVTFLLVWRIVPETKGRSLEDIERFWLPEAIDKLRGSRRARS